MTTIGGAWYKTKETGLEYISIKFDKEILPLTITEDKVFTLFAIPETERTKENSPHYRVTIGLPKDKRE